MSKENTPKRDATYVHESIEVKWTGRVAIKRNGTVIHYLYEMEPADRELPASFKKWVKASALYEIHDYRGDTNG